MLLLNKDDIRKVFSMEDAIEANKKAFSMIASKSLELPLRTKLSKELGTYLVMPVASSGMGGAVKIYTHFDSNAEKNIPTSCAQVFLIDEETGSFLALLDGSTVTKIRTGAASGCAFDVLAKESCRVGAVIGSGNMAEDQLEAMLCARKLEEVKIYSRTKEKRESFAARMQEKFGAKYGVNIAAASSAEEAVSDADLVITVTPSSEPLFDGKALKPGATVSCVGSYQPHMRELGCEAFSRASKIFFDMKSAVLAECGNVLTPLKEGAISEEDITGEIGQVILGEIQGRESDEEIIIFETVGSAVQDLTAARLVYEKALEFGIGTEWS